MKKHFRSLLRASAIFFAMSGGYAAAQQDTSTVKETHGDWEIRCVGEGQCYMQQVDNAEDGQALMLMRLRKLPEPVTRNDKTYVVEVEVFVRLGYYLPAGITMQIDEGTTHGIPYERCLPNGCGSQPLFTETVVNSLKNGGAANFSMLQTPQKKIDASISLSGFTAAYNAL